MNQVTIEIEEGVDALSKLQKEWQSLFAESGAPPFLSWEWLSTWHRWFGEGKHPYLLCARENEKLIGLLPLCAEKRQSSRLAPRMKRLSFLGEDYGAPDYLDIVSIPGSKQKCADLFMNYLASLQSFDLLELEGLSSDSYTLHLLTRRFANNDKFKYKIVPQYICPRMSLDASWENLLERCQRTEYFKRCIRRLNKIESFEFRVVSDISAIPAAYGRFLGLHAGRWIDRGGSSAVRTTEQKGFMYETACELAGAHMTRFEEIWLEGQCRASLFGFESGDTYYFYLSGFDQEWSKYSLGFTLLWLSIREALQRGLKMYDFLRGDEAYKFDWSDNLRMTVTAQVASDSRAAKWHLAQSHTNEIARAILPDWLKVQLRRVRARISPAPVNIPAPNPELLKGRGPKYKEPALAK